MGYKMKYTALLFMAFLAGFAGESYGQQENVWVFGTHTGISFNSDSPALTSPLTAIEGFGEANASVCDYNGNLLFYT